MIVHLVRPGFWTSPPGQIAIALAASAVAGLVMLVAPTPFVAAGLGLAPLFLIFALRKPVVLCLAFLVFSYFRIHEVFPALSPLRIPQLIALPTLFVLFWHLVMTRSIRPFWCRELSVFATFFMLVTVGVVLATDTGRAMGYWTSTYVKIGIMTLAIAWLIRTPKDFALVANVMLASGVAVSSVTLYNKANEIGLVEGTRVTIGRDIGSLLGDPNDLSLVLLFPMSFALAHLTVRTGVFRKILGLLIYVMIVSAIIATQSRGGLLGTVAVTGIVANRVIKSKVVLGSLGGIGLIGLAAVAGISSRASGGAHEDGIDESAMGRLYAWQAAWGMALARPLTGVGIENFTTNYFFYVPVWTGKVYTVHSTWFEVLSSTGFPGIFTFVFMLVSVFLSCLRSRRLLEVHGSRQQEALAINLAIVAGLTGFCVSGTFLTQGFLWPPYILLALAAAASRYANDLSGTATDAPPRPPPNP